MHRPADAAASARRPPMPQIVVTASHLNLLGTAVSASQGSITQQKIKLRPIDRPGQLLEASPGLVVPVHAGAGKAQHYVAEI